MHVLLEHSNRGKQSLGLDLTSEDGLDDPLQAGRDLRRLPHQQAAVACAPSCRIDVDDIRAHNPNIIYVRGTGQGERGPDADKGSYDSLAYWNRAGHRHGQQAAPTTSYVPGAARPGLRRLHRRHDDRRRDHGRAVPPRAHRRGDHRRRVAARHRASGRWARPWRCRCSIDMPVGAAAPAACRPATRSSATTRPRTAAYVALVLPAGRQVLARSRARSSAGPSWPTDERFADAAAIIANGAEGRRRSWPRPSPSAPSTSGASSSADFTGQWTVVQDTLEAAADPQIGRQRLRQRLRDGRRRRRSSWPRRPCSTTSEPAAGPAGAGVQRARRRHPREPRLRLGHDRRPQGPRRRRLTAEPHRARPPPTCVRHTTDPWSRAAQVRVSDPAGGPVWGDAAHLVDLLDVRPEGPGRFVSVARADERRPVVEGSQMLGQAIVAADRHAPGRRARVGVDGLPPGGGRRPGRSPSRWTS